MTVRIYGIINLKFKFSDSRVYSKLYVATEDSRDGYG